METDARPSVRFSKSAAVEDVPWFFPSLLPMNPFRIPRRVFALLAFIATVALLAAAPARVAIALPPGYVPPKLPVIPAHRFDVRGYGAVGDGTSDNTKALQAAIDAAAKAGGGVVEVPAGVFLSGPLTLASRVNLQLLAGCTLQMLSLDQ
jgi:hypothetical protein